MRRGRTSGSYDAGQNVLHIWYEQPVVCTDELAVNSLFDEVENIWVRACPKKPYLLVNYANVRIAPAVTDTYARRIERLKVLVLGTFRYDVGTDLTGVTITMGNMSVGTHANIYPDEASARAAIDAARARAAKG
jgi:hypothetical protein